MGAFSEMNIDNTALQVPQTDTVEPFVVEQESVEDVSVLFPDDAQQEAESEAAQAALAKLAQGKEKEEADLSVAQKKKEHEEQEAKRKAEWEAKQRAKAEAEQIAWENAVALNDEDLMRASLKRIGADTERLTRRNMKLCVSEHIQTKCLEDMDFARQVMHPRKNMVNCFRYINRRARAFIEQAMKDNDEKPLTPGVYGDDVPDGICYQWAEEYFLDLDAEEDKEKDEKFVPKSFAGSTTSKRKKETAKKAASTLKTTPPALPKEEQAQISLLEVV